MVFELLKTHLIEDDNELSSIFHEYKSGRMTSGEIKQIACEKITAFMESFKEKLEKARKQVDKLNFVRFS